MAERKRKAVDPTRIRIDYMYSRKWGVHVSLSGGGGYFVFRTKREDARAIAKALRAALKIGEVPRG